MMRKAVILTLAGLTAACATAGGREKGPAPQTPERYQLKVEEARQEIALAPRADGLSPAQRTALADLATRFKLEKGDLVTVQAPKGSGEAGVRSAWNAKAALEIFGVPKEKVRVVEYDSEPGAPVLVGYMGLAAVIPDCGEAWNNLTSTRDNRAHVNFGCAVTANLAAQIADPADILGGRPLDPSDATRRQVTLNKYRQGQATSSETDKRANGKVAEVVQ